MSNPIDTSGDTVELSATDGVAFIEQASPLTRLHYFDGQFLRAASFTVEQEYHRSALQLANLAGGWGAATGFGIALTGEQLTVSAGLAVTPGGHLVRAGADMQAKLADLLGSAQPAAPPGSAVFSDCLQAPAPTATASAGLQIYEITVGPVDGLCGNEAVFGKLCETACATDSRRPYWREGVVLRLRPIQLSLAVSSAVPATGVHLRNRIASAYFAREPGQPASLLSAAGLASGIRCQPAQTYDRDEVVVGLLWRDAGTARVDAWSGRRERMDTQPRAYWQGRMGMRPWNVFLAQVLQFQCQLSGLFDANSPVLQPADDCDRIRTALGDARKEIEALLSRFQGSGKGLLFKAGERETFKRLQDASSAFKSSYADLSGLSDKLAGLDVGSGAQPKQRMLLNGGFFELPPAGYLPVSVGQDVAVQCQRMFGEGVVLHYQAVRHDEIAHLVEEAEHLDRISLTRGLDDPRRRDEIEIFVPEGQIADAASAAAGIWWHIQVLETAVAALDGLQKAKAAVVVKTNEPAAPSEAATQTTAAGADVSEAGGTEAPSVPQALDGLIRTETRDDGSFGFALAVGSDPLPAALQNSLKAGFEYLASSRLQLYLSGDADADPFALSVGDSTDFKGEWAGAYRRDAQEIQLKGSLTVLKRQALDDGTEQRLVQIDVEIVDRAADGSAPTSTATRVRLVLQRDGDARTGFVSVDDENQDPQSSPLFLDWRDAPRRATVGVAATRSGRVLGQRFETLSSIYLRAGTDGVSQDAAGNRLKSAPGETAYGQRTRLISMSALPAMPEPNSALGSATLDTLASVAEANDDAALLLRARRRLFPVLDAPKTQSVKALLDWVMFRRARTPLCGPTCAAPAAAAIESFQVWHLRATDVETVARLKKALDSGNAKLLGSFDFKRVGLLRYRDESAYAEESAAQVQQLWKLANPGARVVLGRVWELAPTTGQGWQNRMRLRHMLDQIDGLSKEPPAGDGSLAAIAPPPGILGDRASDGGMLVVTLAEDTHVHRIAFLPFDLYRGLVEIFKNGRNGPADGLARLDAGIAGVKVATDLDAHFTGSVPAPADATAVGTADTGQRNAANHNANVFVHIFRVDAEPLPSGVEPSAESQVIAKLVGANPNAAPDGGDDGNVSAPLSDLGRGAAVLTLLGYEDRS